MQLLLEQQRVGAERHELLLRYDALDDLGHLAMDQWLAARDCHHGRAAFIDGVQAFLDSQPAIEDRIGIVDLAAADAGEIAAEQRLQHQYERIAFAPKELLLEDISADTHFLEKGNSHFFCLPIQTAQVSTPQAVTGFVLEPDPICSSGPG